MADYNRPINTQHPQARPDFAQRFYPVDMSAQMEQGNGATGGFGIAHSIDFRSQNYLMRNSRNGGLTRRNEEVNQSIFQKIEDKIEDIKQSPSMEGCGKDTIIAIIFIVAVITGIAYLVVHHWQSITGMIEPFFEWFQ